MVKKIKQEQKQGNDLDLSVKDIGFYAALVLYETVKQLMGDKELRDIPHILTITISYRILVVYGWVD
ncbi:MULTISPECIES: type I restriction enzyme endonuclease domain-containing protein [unclassified Mammaliicoccus]|uniref:type I restriction enzyme endonuclease domain-containing protein n=1 Tax=unclassified Mammaliicoccus TaxID=2803851 RepID=UPI001EFB084E|nr:MULTISPECIES: type I restriction enzyme endonuclease domain-containing protein [unclassified Mammaliicoccus]